MSERTLCDNVLEAHTAGWLPTGQRQVYVGKRVIHEVTSPQSFDMIRERGLTVRRPGMVFAVVDHVIPTDDRSRPFKDEKAEIMTATLEKNVEEFGIEYFAPGSGKQGVCHVTFPEQGLIWPGMIVVCGDSHTSTYGALGALAFGIGTTQLSHVLATSTVAMKDLKVRRVNFNGNMNEGVTAKDLVMYMIKELGAGAGAGFAYEIGGEVIDKMGMPGRFTICNMGVEGGAKACYVNPDEIAFEYLRERPFAPKKDFDKLVEYAKSIASAEDAVYDDIADIDVSKIEPMVTWGIDLSQVIGIRDRMPTLDGVSERELEYLKATFKYMELEPGKEILGTPLDRGFMGSCTEGRLENFVYAARILEGRKVKIRTLFVPGSEKVKHDAEELELDKIFKAAGAEWRYPGCSMCLAMNPDQLPGTERSGSTSNRNYKGRQGKKGARTHVMSVLTAAASAIEGRIADPRDYLRG